MYKKVERNDNNTTYMYVMVKLIQKGAYLSWYLNGNKEISDSGCHY
jgi:hypothetical protein